MYVNGWCGLGCISGCGVPRLRNQFHTSQTQNHQLDFYTKVDVVVIVDVGEANENICKIMNFQHGGDMENQGLKCLIISSFENYYEIQKCVAETIHQNINKI